MKDIFVTRASLPPFEEYLEKIRPIWESAWLTNMGEMHQIFESELISYLDVKNISLLVNGHMALEMAIQAFNLKGEVITTPFTFASTTHAIVRNGLEPVFCDINKNDYTINVNKIEELITDQTSAIVPVHIYGQVCDVEGIEKIAQKYGLKVIYDAAHSFGITVNGMGIGNFGDASIFSFHATKVFNSIEGGAVTFKNDEIKKNLYHLKNFGIESQTEVNGVGANAKMNEFQAAMGICNLKYIDENIAKRKEIVDRYKMNLNNINGIEFVRPQKGVVTNYSYFPIVIDEKRFKYNRDQLFNKLSENNIYARKYFYPLTNQFKCYKDRFTDKDTPVAKYISERVLTLPLYADLELDDVDKICSCIIN